MLVATTIDALAAVDPSILKKGPSSVSACLDLLDTPIASSWSPENNCLFLASGNTIQKYDPVLNNLRDVYTSEAPITHMVARTSSCVIFASGNEIQVLEGHSITQTLKTHKNTINSLSLSNDGSLLASTSSGAVHIHNLALGSHSSMRGLANEISSATFDFHSRTRLLVASGRQLIIFDITRPAGPIKTVSLNESTTGDLIPIACSPFSKTLVAIATSDGFVGLVDLEKEKALLRTLNIKAPLTTIAFSPEGTAIYLGTQTGKILVVDLRALDKPPKVVSLSDIGSAIQTISIQKKTKGPPMKTPTAIKKEAPVARKTVPGKSPVRKPPAPSSPVARRPSTSPSKRISDPKKVLSPVRDPHGNARLSSGNISSKPLASPTTKAISNTENPRRTRTLPPTSSTAPIRKSSASTVAAPRTSPVRRPLTLSSASHITAMAPPQTRSAQRSSPVSRSNSRATQRSKTPSPGLPDLHADPVTPIPAHKQRKRDIEVLGLGTPDVDLWVRAGAEDVRANGKGKTVGFQDRDDVEAGPSASERERILSMQISPRRPVPSTSATSDSWKTSPVLDTSLGANSAGSTHLAGGGPAHELLKTIVQDVMYDFQRETKADMMGLHLDLLRMGRGWKTELRTLMDEYVGDLKDLREENQRLRLENERLRRAAY